MLEKTGKDYYVGHGNPDIPAVYKTKENIWPGRWLYLHRKAKSSGT